MKEDKRGIGLKFAINGLLIIIREERNFKIHLTIALLTVIISGFLRINKFEWLIIILTIHFVLLMELINSVVERLIDYLKPEYNLQAKTIKDVSAAVVLIAALMSLIVGAIIFLPKLSNLFN